MSITTKKITIQFVLDKAKFVKVITNWKPTAQQLRSSGLKAQKLRGQKLWEVSKNK